MLGGPKAGIILGARDVVPGSRAIHCEGDARDKPRYPLEPRPQLSRPNAARRDHGAGDVTARSKDHEPRHLSPHRAGSGIDQSGSLTLEPVGGAFRVAFRLRDSLVRRTLPCSRTVRLAATAVSGSMWMVSATRLRSVCRAMTQRLPVRSPRRCVRIAGGGLSERGYDHRDCNSQISQR